MINTLLLKTTLNNLHHFNARARTHTHIIVQEEVLTRLASHDLPIPWTEVNPPLHSFLLLFLSNFIIEWRIIVERGVQHRKARGECRLERWKWGVSRWRREVAERKEADRPTGRVGSRERARDGKIWAGWLVGEQVDFVRILLHDILHTLQDEMSRWRKRESDSRHVQLRGRGTATILVH